MFLWTDVVSIFKPHRTTTLCLKKVPTIKLSVILSKLNRFFIFLNSLKAHAICYKIHMTIPTSP